ncbi:MAG: prefoldin subunit beta [Candidatus Nanoarchaeia archaeon]
MSDNTEKLQMLEQNIQNYSRQRQQFQLHLKEVESAIAELEDTDESYKIIGNIMVKSSKDKLKKELNDKKRAYDVRIKNLQEQEEKLKKKSEELRAG